MMKSERAPSAQNVVGEGDNNFIISMPDPQRNNSLRNLKQGG